MGEEADKILRYENFLNHTLRGDLRKVLDERDKIYEQIAEYLQLKTTIERVKETKSQELKTRVDLGCNFYVQAKVPDTSRIFVLVGYGFFVEFTLSEGISFIDKKVAFLTNRTDALTKDAAKIKAHIKLVLEGLRELQGIDDRPPQRPRREVY